MRGAAESTCAGGRVRVLRQINRRSKKRPAERPAGLRVSYRSFMRAGPSLPPCDPKVAEDGSWSMSNSAMQPTSPEARWSDGAPPAWAGYALTLALVAIAVLAGFAVERAVSRRT